MAVCRIGKGNLSPCLCPRNPIIIRIEKLCLAAAVKIIYAAVRGVFPSNIMACHRDNNPAVCKPYHPVVVCHKETIPWGAHHPLRPGTAAVRGSAEEHLCHGIGGPYQIKQANIPVLHLQKGHGHHIDTLFPLVGNDQFSVVKGAPAVC